MITTPTLISGTVSSTDRSCFLQQADLHRLTLRLYDVDAQIVSDSGRYLGHIGNLFQRFVIAPEAAQNPVHFVFLTGANNPWQSPLFSIDDQEWFLGTPCPPEEYIYTRILSAIVSRIQSHMMIQAGMVAHKGRGLMLVADSYHGKTTLTLELVRRGFLYLSDDMAAFSREDQLVHPFPLRIGMRPGTWSLVMGDAPLPPPPTGSEKTLIDCENIWPESSGSPVMCQTIVFLHSAAVNQDLEADQAIQNSTVIVDRINDELLSAIKSIDGLCQLSVTKRHGVVILAIQSENTTALLEQVEAECTAQRVLVLHISKGGEKRPTFEGPVNLTSISKREAVLGLLNKFQGGYSSQMLQKSFNDNPTRLLMALTSAVGPASCYQLSVGPLGKMADQLCRLMELENLRESKRIGKR